MDNYEYFNKWAYRFYLERSSALEIGSFAIDLEEFIKINDTDLKFSIINSRPWSELLAGEFLDGDLSIPKYFGLIALQCYAALLMENDGFTTVRVYQTRLIELVGLKGVSSLQDHFNEEILRQPVQELIWKSAKDHFKSLNIDVKIPEAKQGAGRYVQYPISQIVLNKEDLKEYIPFFESLSNEKESISFKDLKNSLKKNKIKFNASFTRANNKKESLNPLENLMKARQIFDFYCSDWKNIYIEPKNQKAEKIKAHNIAVLENDEVFLFDDCFNAIDIENIKIDEYLFFKHSEYLNEYDQQNTLEYDTEFLICFRNGTQKIDFGILVEFKHINYSFIKVSFKKEDQIGKLGRFIYDKYPIRLKGLRVNRKRSYLKGFGPSLEILSPNLNFSIYHLGMEVLDFDHAKCNIGDYKIRLSNYNDLSFSIIDVDGLDENIDQYESGWCPKSYSLVHEGSTVQGLLFNFNNGQMKKKPSVNNWISNQRLFNYGLNQSRFQQKILKYSNNEGR